MGEYRYSESVRAQMYGQGYMLFCNNEISDTYYPPDRMIVLHEYQEALSYLNEETLNKDLTDG